MRCCGVMAACFDVDGRDVGRECRTGGDGGMGGIETVRERVRDCLDVETISSAICGQR